jgi:hypothetical protein
VANCCGFSFCPIYEINLTYLNCSITIKLIIFYQGGNVLEEKNMAVIIGGNIKKCLEEYQMDLKAWAKIISVTRQTASNYVEGLSIIDSYKLHLTANRFHKCLEWFLEVEHKDTDYLFTSEQKEWIRKEIVAIAIQERVKRLDAQYSSSEKVRQIEAIEELHKNGIISNEDIVKVAERLLPVSELKERVKRLGKEKK